MTPKYIRRELFVRGVRETWGQKFARIRGIANAAARFCMTPSTKERTGLAADVFYRSQFVAESAASPIMPVADRR